MVLLPEIYLRCGSDRDSTRQEDFDANLARTRTEKKKAAIRTSPWLDLQPCVAPPTRQVMAAESLGHYGFPMPRDRFFAQAQPAPAKPSENVTFDLGGGPPV